MNTGDYVTFQLLKHDFSLILFCFSKIIFVSDILKKAFGEGRSAFWV